MERIRQQMEEGIQKQKRLQTQNQAKTETSQAKENSQYYLALGGVAAGLTIAAIIWLTKSIVTTDHMNLSEADKAVTVHTGLIRKSADHITLLNERVESLTEAVSRLEARLTKIMTLTDSIVIVDSKLTAATQRQTPQSADDNYTSDVNESRVPSTVNITPGSGQIFIPTHTVNSRVNLRPSASLNTKPIAVLDVGTAVETISKSDDWYYVNTRSHGKGWCSSDYLSPLLPEQQKSSAN